MRPRRALLLLLSLLSAFTAAASPAPPGAATATVTVAVAANAQFAAVDILAAFGRVHAAAVRSIVGASGTFAAQILNGAPIDILLSADMDYPEELRRAGLVLAGPRIYAYGALVLWTTRGIDLSAGLRALASPLVGRIAVPAPATAPYGVAALAALEKAGLLDSVRPKLVYGESIAQVNGYVTSGAADAGFTAKSVVLSPALRGTGTWVEVDPALYQPVAQGVVLLRNAGADPRRLEAARALYDFLFTPEARAILGSYGYRLPGAPGAP